MPEQTRQLAAIMFTDIVGYTALMGRDEQKAFAILQKNSDIHAIAQLLYPLPLHSNRLFKNQLQYCLL